MRFSKALTVLLVSLILVMIVGGKTSHAIPAPITPNPVLYLTSTEAFTKGGKSYIRYLYDVLNKSDYPAEFSRPPRLYLLAAQTRSPPGPGSTSLIRVGNGYLALRSREASRS